jgi:hypothetical protein
MEFHTVFVLQEIAARFSLMTTLFGMSCMYMAQHDAVL